MHCLYPKVQRLAKVSVCFKSPRKKVNVNSHSAIFHRRTSEILSEIFRSIFKIRGFSFFLRIQKDFKEKLESS